MTISPQTLVLSTTSDFGALRKMIMERSLMKRQPVYYTYKTLQVLFMLLAGFAMVLLTESLWMHILAAVYLAFVFGQIGLLFHDAGHRQIFSNSKYDNIIGYCSALMLGASLHAWMFIHNQHHAHPNREDSDPDISLPFFAYSEKQAEEAKNGRNIFLRLIIRNQGLMYFPLLSFTMFSMRATSWKFLIRNRSKALKYWPDWTCCSANIILYLGAIFLAMPLLHAILFLIIHQTLWGFYMGSVFAPNHKGMPIIENDSTIDYFQEQVLTSRNVRSGPFIDLIYGGLNYQIEHHLFPNMPRNKLKQANLIVKQYCKEHGVPYHETGMVRSYCEIVRHMNEIATHFRRLKRQPA